MRSLSKPTVAVSAIVDLCVASVQDEELKARLKAASPTIQAAAGEYMDFAAGGRWHEIKQADQVDNLSGKEMERIYNRTFVRSAGTKPLYGALKKACRNDLCPLCAQRTVHTLDHYLPISKHPVFAITPVNLVPACPECNKIKLAHSPTSAEEQTLHPYFDDITATRWLYGKVMATTPASVVFHASPPAEMGQVLQARVARHFKTFSLGALYAAHAGEELGNLRYGLTKIAEARDPFAAVRGHLAVEAQSRRAAHLNSWQTAMYEALATSDWFCAGGYLHT